MKNLVVSLLAGLLFVGCASNVKQIGQVGPVQFYRVRANSFSGPNIASLVTQNKTTGEVKIEQTYAGPGLGAATISAVGHVGAAAVLGTSFPKNVGDNIQASGGVTSANSAAGANAGANSNSSSNATGGNGTSTSNATGGSYDKNHPDSPGNGGIPGNGGQNGNGNNHP